ncbi:FAD-dependent oxidoreductase [Paraburkholderia sp. A2WS-5]|uniref:FAD-dependent oxidoreductase n=1 Tax=Paraburkholderia sp. A2WS-5 TaxID=3028372 RepID=UPI003B7F673F
MCTLRFFPSLILCHPFADDSLNYRLKLGVHFTTPRIAGPDVPGGGAIMRPTLARILADATRASGTRVRLGCTFTSIEQDAEGVEVTFSDSSRQRYDLVIGADGLYSKTRELLFPDAPKPKYSGQGVWRAVLPRPSGVKTAMMWVGGKVKPGVNPVSAKSMYMFITEHRPVNEYINPAEFADRMTELLKAFTDPQIQEMLPHLQGPNAQIIYRPLEGLLVPQPWYAGRVVLIGDTVHATTPHLASGACIGIEDAIVLSEEISKHANLTDALAAFQLRRWDRCSMVVRNSARLGEIEITSGDKEEHARIMRDSMMALAASI